MSIDPETTESECLQGHGPMASRAQGDMISAELLIPPLRQAEPRGLTPISRSHRTQRDRFRCRRGRSTHLGLGPPELGGDRPPATDLLSSLALFRKQMSASDQGSAGAFGGSTRLKGEPGKSTCPAFFLDGLRSLPLAFRGLVPPRFILHLARLALCSSVSSSLKAAGGSW